MYYSCLGFAGVEVKDAHGTQTTAVVEEGGAPGVNKKDVLMVLYLGGVLMAEDNPHDIIATKRAWKKNNIVNPLYIVNNGEECLDYLLQRGRYSDHETAPRPGVLLLDIKMPRMDGLTLLKHIREDQEFKAEGLHRLPVVVLTTSHEEQDRLQSYDLGANAYITKPVGFDNFSEAVRRIHLFWKLVELPEREGWYEQKIMTN